MVRSRGRLRRPRVPGDPGASAAGRRRSESRSATCAPTGSCRGLRDRRGHPAARIRRRTASRSHRARPRGDTYRAEVYTPQPPENQRRRAETDLEPSLSAYTTIDRPPRAVRLRAKYETFPFFGTARPDRRTNSMPDGRADAAPAPSFRGSTARAANCAGARDTPKDYLQASRCALSATGHYKYSETPPPASRDARRLPVTPSRGTASSSRVRWRCCCGSGGSPHAWATGFGPGATDAKTGEYIVRDFDAHSWVEAYSRASAGSRSTRRRPPRPRAASPPMPPASPAAASERRRSRPATLADRGAGVAVAGERRRGGANR